MNETKIAYFSMEIALEEGIPTYSGGLGVLAGDMLRSAADLKIPLLGVTLLYHKGYFFQELNQEGAQTEKEVNWIPADFLQKLPHQIEINIEDRKVQVGVWQYNLPGKDSYVVPIYLLDTDLAENSPYDRTLTSYLYGGDDYYRFCQEIILGIGGIKILRSLGYHSINRFHMNEGHASLLTLELLDEVLLKAKKDQFSEEDLELVKKQCIFTTHTPIKAGHDQFSQNMVEKILQRKDIFKMKEVFSYEGLFNMTNLALNLSHYVNGVAKSHGEISRKMFSKNSIDSITNGVYAPSWVSSSFQDLFNHYIPGWKEDNFSLRSALAIPKNEIWNAHMQQKKLLIEYINCEKNEGFDFDIFTIGFARRATAYKRGDLFFQDIEKIKELVKKVGPIQIIYAGKAHPKDFQGKEIIKKIFRFKNELKEYVKVIYLQNYDIEMAKKLVSGVDLWLNTPQIPMEASGTSGMKAALNGIPMLSTLDGWWVEGCIEGITGWSIGLNLASSNDNRDDVNSLFDKLENKIIPIFYNNREAYINVMAHCIALNGSFFNTHRMLLQYLQKAYF